MKVSADYRMLALDALRGKWKTAVLTGIAASALGATIVSSSNSAVSNSNQAKDIHFELFSQPNGGRLLAVLLAGIVLWAVLQLIVGGAVIQAREKQKDIERHTVFTTRHDSGAHTVTRFYKKVLLFGVK